MKSKLRIDERGNRRWLHPKTYQIHRLDGPARENVIGTKEWWVMGKQLALENGGGKLSNDRLNRLKPREREIAGTDYA